MAHLGTVPIRGVLSQRVGLEVCDGGHRLDVMKKSVPVASSQYFPKLHVAVESQVSKTAKPGGTPGFPLSTSKDNSRYTRAGDAPSLLSRAPAVPS